MRRPHVRFVCTACRSAFSLTAVYGDDHVMSRYCKSGKHVVPLSSFISEDDRVCATCKLRHKLSCQDNNHFGHLPLPLCTTRTNCKIVCAWQGQRRVVTKQISSRSRGLQEYEIHQIAQNCSKHVIPLLDHTVEDDRVCLVNA